MQQVSQRHCSTCCTKRDVTGTQFYSLQRAITIVSESLATMYKGYFKLQVTPLQNTHSNSIQTGRFLHLPPPHAVSRQLKLRLPKLAGMPYLTLKLAECPPPPPSVFWGLKFLPLYQLPNALAQLFLDN